MTLGGLYCVYRLGVTYSQDQTRKGDPMPSGYTERSWKGELCGAYEIAQFANVTKAQVSHWSKEDWFPKPLDEPRMGRIWSFAEVSKALTDHGYPRERDSLGKKVRRGKTVVAVDVVD